MFSPRHVLDSGTSFLLGHLTLPSGPLKVIDLGCGNGVLGMKIAVSNPEAEVTFIDESYRAVASRRGYISGKPRSRTNSSIPGRATECSTSPVEFLRRRAPSTGSSTIRRSMKTTRSAMRRPGGCLPNLVMC